MGKIIRTITENKVIDKEGELQHYDSCETHTLEQEPPYVKVYLKPIPYMQDLPQSYRTILSWMLKEMKYAHDGQIITISAGTKRKMSKTLGVSLSRINHAITDFVKGKLIFREDMGVFQVNPQLFGKGDWKDISKLRHNIDFNAEGKTVNGEIKKSTHKKELVGQQEEQAA